MKTDLVKDQTLKKQGVKILPWIGNNYEQGVNGKKVLALGYSIYGNTPEDASPEATRNRMERYLNVENVKFDLWMSTYTKFIRALSGEQIKRAESNEWWQKIMFYNYVQEPLTGTRVEPSDEQLIASIDPFKVVLMEYKPDVILTWGKSLFQVLPGFGGYEADPIDDNNIWVYEKDGHKIYVLEMTHPAAGYTWEYWNEVFEQLWTRV